MGGEGGCWKEFSELENLNSIEPSIVCIYTCTYLLYRVGTNNREYNEIKNWGGGRGEFEKRIIFYFIMLAI